jgi:rare lipoprotein A
MVFGKVRWAERVRLVIIASSASALAAVLLTVNLTTTAEAKTPGSTYCYYGVCHRVKTIAETQALVGVDESIMASHYDDCSRDRYNPCGLTSSGERFHPDRPDNTASPIYPDGTTLLVWSPDTERALIVRVNNAGPYWGDRTLDLSRAAAEKLGFDGRGVAKVRVRVVKAPEPEEATYVANRTYPPVPGDIGEYPTLQQAETAMAVVLALQATAASPLAPVTTANAFARPDAEPLVAEAPQSFGRANVKLASLDPQPESDLQLSAVFAQSQKRARREAEQSRQQFASLSPTPTQSKWDGEVVDEPLRAVAPLVAGVEKPHVIKTELPSTIAMAKADPVEAGTMRTIKTQQPAAMAMAKADRVEVTASEVQSAPRKRQAVAERQVERKKVAARTERRSRNERRSRGTRVAGYEQRYERPRMAYERPSRSAGQVMSANIRAESSSTM